MQQVAGTSPIVWTSHFCHKIWWQKIWSLRLLPRIKTGLNFWNKSLWLILQNTPCKLFVGTSPWEQIEIKPITDRYRKLPKLLTNSVSRRPITRKTMLGASLPPECGSTFTEKIDEWDRNYKDNSSKSKTNKVLSPLVVKFEKSSAPWSLNDIKKRWHGMKSCILRFVKKLPA